MVPRSRQDISGLDWKILDYFREREKTFTSNPLCCEACPGYTPVNVGNRAICQRYLPKAVLDQMLRK